MTEQELLVDCINRLNRSGVAYLVTGSMASNFWGIPRSTHDLDFVIQLPSASVPKILEAFANDFHLDEQSVRAASRPPYQFNAIHRHSSLKVDFWLPVNSAFEREMFRRRVQYNVFGAAAWIATAEDIILHKLFWDKTSPSERQRGDVAGVYAIQKESLDGNYLRQWAAELGVLPTLELMFDGKLKLKTT